MNTTRWGANREGLGEFAGAKKLAGLLEFISLVIVHVNHIVTNINPLGATVFTASRRNDIPILDSWVSIFPLFPRTVGGRVRPFHWKSVIVGAFMKLLHIFYRNYHQV